MCCYYQSAFVFVCFEIFSSFALIFQICALKVEGNEKLGGAGGWLLFKDGKRLWQSTSVWFWMSLSCFSKVFPFSVCKVNKVYICIFLRWIWSKINIFLSPFFNIFTNSQYINWKFIEDFNLLIIIHLSVYL